MIEPLPKITCKTIDCEYLREIRVGDSFDRAAEFSCKLNNTMIDPYCDHGELKIKIPKNCLRKKL